jgi:hypothetical protein
MRVNRAAYSPAGALPGVVVGQEGCVDLGPVCRGQVLAGQGKDLLLLGVHVLPLVLIDVMQQRRVEACKARLAAGSVGFQGVFQHGHAGLALVVLLFQPGDDRLGLGTARAQRANR